MAKELQSFVGGIINAEAVFDQGLCCFTVPSSKPGAPRVPVRGLHPFIATTFGVWTVRKAVAASSRAARDTGTPPPDVGAAVVTQERAMALGSECDDQMARVAAACHGGATVREVYDRLTSGHARNVCKWLIANGLEPVAAQVPLGSLALRLGTAADLVCRSRHDPGELHVLEIKCGMDGTRDLAMGTMNKSYSPPHTPNTPLERARAQLCMTRSLLTASFPGIRESGMVVVARVLVAGHTSDGVDSFDLGDWTRATARLRLAALKQRGPKKYGRKGPRTRK